MFTTAAQVCVFHRTTKDAISSDLMNPVQLRYLSVTNPIVRHGNGIFEHGLNIGLFRAHRQAGRTAQARQPNHSM